MRKCIGIGLLMVGLGLQTGRAQLAITETMSSAANSFDGSPVEQGPDFWELTNFGTNAVDLTGYRFNDADATLGGDADSSTLLGVTIGPGESIILVQTGTGVDTREDFFSWWGAANLPENLQVLFYSGNGMAAGGDSIVLWDASASADGDYVDRADFGEALRGHSFAYNLTNGTFGVISTNGIAGVFPAATSDDVGSPGFAPGPVALTITQQPTNLTVFASQTATFTVAAIGFPRAHYQWLYNGDPIAGATAGSLVLTNVQAGQAGTYSVVVTNGLQELTSADAVLTVNAAPTPPVFSALPKNANAFIGQTVTFSAQAGGSPVPLYQWRYNGVDLPGQTANQLVLSNVQSNDAGIYTIVAYNLGGTNTASANLVVTTKPRLYITEVESNESPGGGHEDWWELTSFEDFPVNLLGYRWDDSSESLAPNNAYTFTNDVTIHPGESIIFVENLSAAQFRTWWGTNLPPNLQIVTYVGNGLGLSSSADAVNVWNGVSTTGTSSFEKLASVTFAVASEGRTFVYNPDNPPVGGVLNQFATNGVNGAFTAAVSGDIGSPGYVVEPMRVTASVSGGATLLTWNSVAGRNYTVQYKNGITDAGWTTLTNLTAGGSVSTASDSAANSQRYYRVGVNVPFPQF